MRETARERVASERERVTEEREGERVADDGKKAIVKKKTHQATTPFHLSLSGTASFQT